MPRDPPRGSFANAPKIPDPNIIPFFSGDPRDQLGPWELDLAKKLSNRTPLADVLGLTQAMVSNPNAVLQADLGGFTVTATTVLQASTVIKKKQQLSSGGGVSNIAFLEGAPGGVPVEGTKFTTSGANAKIVEVESTFWIETTKDSRGKIGHVLQDTQLVLMDFHGTSWSHVSVAALIKQRGAGATRPAKALAASGLDATTLPSLHVVTRSVQVLRPCASGVSAASASPSCYSATS